MNMHQSARALAFGVVVIGLGAVAFVMPGASSTSPSGLARNPTYADHVATVDAALVRRDLPGAVRASHDAHSAALITGNWRPLLEVGDVMVRIADASGGATGAKAPARLAYLSALRRAQRVGDAVGVMHVAAAFARLGDHAVAGHCFVLAERIATANNDVAALERLRTATAPDSARRASIDSDF